MYYNLICIIDNDILLIYIYICICMVIYNHIYIYRCITHIYIYIYIHIFVLIYGTPCAFDCTHSQELQRQQDALH